MTDVDDQPLKPRTAKEAAQRVLALIAVTSRAREEITEQSLHWVQENNIDSFFSAAERIFYFSHEKPNDSDIVNYSWRAEALISVLWRH